MAASPRRTLSSPSTAATTRLTIADIAQQGLAEQADTAPLTATIPVTFTDLDLSDVGHTAAITHAVATGTTTGLALNQAALIALVTPGAVTKAVGSSAGSVDLSFSAVSTAFDYLAKGEVLTLTYTVSIDDGDGGVTPKTFVVTVTGTDDAPVIANISQKNLAEQTDTASLTATIPVTFTDVDLTDVGHSADITGVVATGATTGLALDQAALMALVTPGVATKNSGSSSGSVGLSFSAASTAFDYLAKGEVLTLTYTVSIDDGDGGATPKTFVVTVTGTDDAPIIADIAQKNLTERTDTSALTATIPVTFTDVDLTDIGHSAESHRGGGVRGHHGACARRDGVESAGDAGRGDQEFRFVVRFGRSLVLGGLDGVRLSGDRQGPDADLHGRDRRWRRRRDAEDFCRHRHRHQRRAVDRG